MEVLLLGTGAADGIPNPFCACPTCADHRERGELRTPTSVLVDGRLLIDPGPEAPRQVSRYGRDLTGLAAIIAGHAHHDHLDPALLMHRSWVTDAALTVAGPEPVTTACRQWVPAESSIAFRTLTAGETIELAGYQVTALTANHEAFGEALCYLISDGVSSLLYATDTGLLPVQTLATLRDCTVDLVLLEETFGVRGDKGDQHLCLDTFAQTVDALRDLGVVAPSTRVVAVHLGHDNPPLTDLRIRLAGCGAEALPDGSLLRF